MKKSMLLTILIVSGIGTNSRVQADPVTLYFSGPLKFRESSPGATYDSVQENELMRGRFTIGGTAGEGTFSPPDTYLFPSDVYHGVLDADGIETSTLNSARLIEVSFENNFTPDAETLDFLNESMGTNFQLGQQFDVANIETDITTGNRRIEFGVNFFFSDLTTLPDSSYRDFPPFEDADLAVYFVVEEEADDEIYNAVGFVTEFGLQAPTIEIRRVSMSANILTVVFDATPDVTGWKVMGGATMDAGLSDDLTTLSTITQDPGVPGEYTAEVDVTGLGSNYFLRIED